MDNLLEKESDVFGTFKEYLSMIEKQTIKQVKYLLTDNELEFCSNELNSFYRSKVILRHLTVPEILQQRSMAKRMNRTLMENVCCML